MECKFCLGTGYVPSLVPGGTMFICKPCTPKIIKREQNEKNKITVRLNVSAVSDLIDEIMRLRNTLQDIDDYTEGMREPYGKVIRGLTRPALKGK